MGEYYEYRDTSCREHTVYTYPDTYIERSAFLALELVGTGYVLKNLATQNFLDRITWIWDLLLGIVIALSRVESSHKFKVSITYLYFY